MIFTLGLCSSLPAVVGLLYPCLDSHLGEPHKFKREWASVMRCVAVFVGINHASVVSFHKSNVLSSVQLPCVPRQQGNALCRLHSRRTYLVQQIFDRESTSIQLQTLP